MWLMLSSVRFVMAKARSCGIAYKTSQGLRNGPISYRYEVTVLMETGLPDHALVSDLIKNGHWNLSPSRRMARQCLMQEIALYELPQLPVEDRIVWSLSPDGN